MKKTLLFLAFLLGIALQSWAYDFVQGGLAYNIVDGNAHVTYMNSAPPRYTSLQLPSNLTIPSSVTYGSTRYSVVAIDEGAFQGCSHLISVTIPNSVTSIDTAAFQSCTGLTSVTIGDSVTDIGWCAFQGCTGLTSVTIPNSVTSIGYATFQDCTGLTSVTIPNSVTSIGVSVFQSCTSLTSVTIGNSVASIGWSAFKGCTGLTSVTIPNSVTSIQASTFQDCTGLLSVTIGNSVTSIDNYAFNNCTGLTAITIPNSVSSIGVRAFSLCTSLTSITIPNSITSIDNKAFHDCTSLTTVNFNATNCTTMGSLEHHVFSNCTALTTLNIGNNVQTIPAFAFCGCSRLTSLTIPNSVTVIGYSAFDGCTGLSEIHSLNNVAPTYVATSFNQITSTIPVYIPCGSLQSYQTGWSYFSNFIEESGIDFNVVSDNESMGTVHIDSYPGCTDSLATVSATANDGYAFDHWSDGSTDNPHTFSVTSGMTITAYFGLAATVTVNSDNTTMGVGIGSSSYAIGGTATISAEANYGYHFTHWNDGNTENPRTINVTVDTSFTAFFEINQYTVNVVSGNTELGSVTGGGTFDYGTSITISAEVLAENHHFAHWQDGNTDNPRTITVTADTTYTAYFAIDEYTVTAVSDNSTMGTTSGSGSYAIGTTAIISANANTGYHFTQWNDGNNDNPRTVTVTCDTTYTAFFEADDFVITVLSDDPSMGTVSGGGIYAYGSTITITATPVDGYMFAYWQDDNNDNPRTITVTGDAEYVAHFYRPEGIDDVDETDNIKIYTRGNTIVIDLSGQQAAGSRQSIVVYDMLGRVIKTDAIKHSSNQTIIPVSGMGIYMVKIGDQPSRKVLVRP